MHMEQQQFRHRQCMRLFWPVGLCDYLKAQDSIQLLLGIYFHAKHVQCGDMSIAAVIGAIKLDQDRQTLQQLLQDNTEHTTASIEHIITSLTVLGCWASTAAASASVAAPEQRKVWLALHGSQQLQEALHLGGCDRARKQSITPDILWQQSRLPEGLQQLQVFVYELPAAQCSRSAQAPRSEHLQQQQQQQEQHPPWMVRAPGTISLDSLLHMLQLAHSSALQHQHLSLQSSSSSTSASDPLRPVQQQQEAAARLHWHQIADQLSWPNSKRQHSQAKQVLGDLQESCLQCWRPRLNRSRLRTDEANAGRSAACNSSSNGNSDVTVLPGLLQHLLGYATAWLLLCYHQQLLQHAAAAGAWLQGGVLQPHIEWLMQARPGGIKLHQELSLLLGSAASTALTLAAAFYTAAWPYLGTAALLALAAVAAIGGAVAACFAAADMLLLLAWPLEVVYTAAAAFHRVQLRCLAATWRLIRGKQKVRRFSERWRQTEQMQAAAAAPAATNPGAAASTSAPTSASTTAAATAPTPPEAAAAAQSTSASDEVSVEQLIVGILLFTPLLGLFPTTVAWYLSVCCCHGALLLLRLALVGLGRMLRLQAMHLLICRWTAPQRFPGQLMVQLLQQRQAEAGSSSGISIGRMNDTGSDYKAAERDAVSTCATTAVGAAGCKMQSVAVSYYHLYNSPLGYVEVLWQFWPWQSVAGDDAKHTWGQLLLGLIAAIMAGKWWGLAFHCS